MRLAPLTLLCVVACAHAEDEFVNRDQGFRIRRPGAGWTQGEIPAPDESRYAFKVWRSDVKDEVSITVYVCDLSGIPDAATACTLAKGRFDSLREASNVRRGDDTLADLDAPFLRMRYTVGEAVYGLRQHYVVGNDSLYVVQSLAPVDAFDKEPFDEVLSTFALVPLADPEARKREAAARTLVARCGSEIDWAKDWKGAASRARREGKLVVVVVELYRGFDFPSFAPSTTFMDADVVELMRERFVGLTWTDGMKAPFLSPSVYGLGPSTFGQGVLFVSPNGRVVAEGVSLDPLYFYSRAVEVLAQHPGKGPRNPGDPAELLRRGDLAEAWTLLKHPRTGAGWRMQAALHRRLRLDEEALGALAKAREAGEEVDVEEGIVRIRLGESAAAEALFGKAKGPEAAYWLACARAMRLGLEPVREELAALVEKHPESRWAWRAAAMLSNLGVMCGMERLTWPEEGVFDITAQRPYAGAADAASAGREAIEFLLENQLPNGAWTSPMSFHGAASPTVAVTSICGMALLPHRDRKEVATAIRKALDMELRTPLVSNPELQFDYTVWGRVFSLRFLAACAREGVGDAARLKAAMNATVRALQAEARTDGGWAYARLQSGDGEDGVSIVFPTAVGLLGLLEARDAGADVPDAMIEKAAGAILALKRRDGTFGYMSIAAGGAPAEASLRSPLCAYALLRAGKGSVASLRKALDVYLEHHDHVRKERGKALCHTSPEGVASYYLLYGYRFASEALSELPEGDRARYAEALLDDVLYFRTEDGAFCDNPGTGRCYGAGMALESIRRLLD